MIVVIEGCSGAGKSTLATALAESLGYPVFRLMRDCEEELFAGVAPVNTWHQDIYATDALVRVGADVVWDRSLPSGLAHVYEGALSDEQRERLIKWWAHRLRDCGLLINLIVDPLVAFARHRHGFPLEHITNEQNQIGAWCRRAYRHGLSAAPIVNDESYSIDEVIETALSAVREVKI
jgi:thymidylate kinase